MSNHLQKITEEVTSVLDYEKYNLHIYARNIITCLFSIITDPELYYKLYQEERGIYEKNIKFFKGISEQIQTNEIDKQDNVEVIKDVFEQISNLDLFTNYPPALIKISCLLYTSDAADD